MNELEIEATISAIQNVSASDNAGRYALAHRVHALLFEMFEPEALSFEKGIFLTIWEVNFILSMEYFRCLIIPVLLKKESVINFMIFFAAKQSSHMAKNHGLYASQE